MSGASGAEMKNIASRRPSSSSTTAGVLPRWLALRSEASSPAAASSRLPSTCTPLPSPPTLTFQPRSACNPGSTPQDSATTFSGSTVACAASLSLTGRLRPRTAAAGSSSTLGWQPPSRRTALSSR